jgi:hypothetical protein
VAVASGAPGKLAQLLATLAKRPAAYSALRKAATRRAGAAAKRAPAAGGKNVTRARWLNLIAGGLLKLENCRLMSQNRMATRTMVSETNVKSSR